MLQLKIRQQDLADMVGISKSFLCSVLRKKRRCSLATAFKIERATRKATTAEELRPDLIDVIKQARKKAV